MSLLYMRFLAGQHLNSFWFVVANCAQTNQWMVLRWWCELVSSYFPCFAPFSFICDILYAVIMRHTYVEAHSCQHMNIFYVDITHVVPFMAVDNYCFSPPVHMTQLYNLDVINHSSLQSTIWKVIKILLLLINTNTFSLAQLSCIICVLQK